MKVYLKRHRFYVMTLFELVFGKTWDGMAQDEINRGSYMSAHVLLNLSNELGKRDRMRGLPSILSRFRNEFNKFKNIFLGCSCFIEFIKRVGGNR